MPNWKTYEATVRLLSALLAAHPTLKLDYAEIFKYYGGDSTYHRIWNRLNGIKKGAKQLRKAVEAGIDPSTVMLEVGAHVKKATSDRFGGDCIVSPLENRFRRLKSDAKLINIAVGEGEDPININVADTDGQIACKRKGAISELMGSETPTSHVASQHRETWKPLGERLIAMRGAGEDCKDVDLTGLGSRRYKAEVTVKMGSDPTAGGIKTQFTRSYRVLAVRQDTKDTSLRYLGAHKQSGDISAASSPYVLIRTKVFPDVAGVKIQYIRDIRFHSRHQIALVAAGKDPKNVLESSKRVEILGHRQVSMLAAGEDSKNVSLEMLSLEQSKDEIVAIMGSDVTFGAIKQQISKRIKALGSRQSQMRIAGEDPKNVDLGDLMPSKQRKEMNKHMGDSTAGSIRYQFDTLYKVIARRQKAILADGKNPSTVDVETSSKTEIQECFDSDATIGGLKFQFSTSIKKNVDQIRNARIAGKDCKDITFGSNATAEKYGDGTTGKAISMRFERMRKEPEWDLGTPSSSTNKSLGSAKKSRAPRTPSKKGKKAAVASSEVGNMDDDSDLDMSSQKGSPIKKEGLHKVKGARVEKKLSTLSRRAKTGVKYTESDEEDRDEILTIKDEDDLDAMDYGRAVGGDDDMLGGGFGGGGYGNIHRTGGIVGGAQDDVQDQFYDDES
ncbi:hypothetical protein DSL72_005463 [Monilinia vaccinii-corymbosi]|uniref:Uncharacterized protein n=1 Tax=Monilinia vaccinii-corymbosi TaxID=61207 RepID=A0A8A3PFQ2_9HELO|nr:hypothetical protein DSL72_005463 [Monilinia vaccinii-corymbosi]